MPSHDYTPIPLEDETFSPSYNTGIPSTAPPSFHSTISSSHHVFSNLPHRHDENAATIIPRTERSPLPLANDTPVVDPGVSIWAPSSSSELLDRDLEAAREDTIARLMERVEKLERRLDGDIEEEKTTYVEKGGTDWSAPEKLRVLLAVLFTVWLCGTITLGVAARYRAAGKE